MARRIMDNSLENWKAKKIEISNAQPNQYPNPLMNSMNSVGQFHGQQQQQHQFMNALPNQLQDSDQNYIQNQQNVLPMVYVQPNANNLRNHNNLEFQDNFIYQNLSSEGNQIENHQQHQSDHNEAPNQLNFRNENKMEIENIEQFLFKKKENYLCHPLQEISKREHSMKIERLRNIILSKENVQQLQLFIEKIQNMNITNEVIEPMMSRGVLDEMYANFSQELNNLIKNDQIFNCKNSNIEANLSMKNFLEKILKQVNEYIIKSIVLNQQSAYLDEKKLKLAFYSYLRFSHIEFCEMISLNLLSLSHCDFSKEVNIDYFYSKFYDLVDGELKKCKENIINDIFNIIKSEQKMDNLKENFEQLKQQILSLNQRFCLLINGQFYNFQNKQLTIKIQEINHKNVFQYNNFTNESTQDILENKIEPLIIYRQLIILKNHIIDLIEAWQNEINLIVKCSLDKLESLIGKNQYSYQKYIQTIIWEAILQNQIIFQNPFIFSFISCQISELQEGDNNIALIINRFISLIQQQHFDRNNYMKSQDLIKLLNNQDFKEACLKKLKIVLKELQISNIEQIPDQQLVFYLYFIINEISEFASSTQIKLLNLSNNSTLKNCLDPLVLSNLNFQVKYVLMKPIQLLNSTIYILLNHQNLNPQKLYFLPSPFHKEKEIDLSKYKEEKNLLILADYFQKIGIIAFYLLYLEEFDSFFSTTILMIQFEKYFVSLRSHFENQLSEITLDQIQNTKIFQVEDISQLIEFIQFQRKDSSFVEVNKNEQIPQAIAFMKQMKWNIIIIDQKLKEDKRFKEIKAQIIMLDFDLPCLEYWFLNKFSLISQNQEKEKFYLTLSLILDKSSKTKIKDKLEGISKQKTKNKLDQVRKFGLINNDIIQNGNGNLNKNYSPPKNMMMNSDIKNNSHEYPSSNFNSYQRHNTCKISDNLNKVIAESSQMVIEEKPQNSSILNQIEDVQKSQIQSEDQFRQSASIIKNEEEFIPLLPKNAQINKFIAHMKQIIITPSMDIINNYLIEKQDFKNFELIDDILYSDNVVQIAEKINSHLDQNKSLFLLAKEQNVIQVMFLIDKTFFFFRKETSEEKIFPSLSQKYSSRYKFYNFIFPSLEFYLGKIKSQQFNLPFCYLLWLTTLDNKSSQNLINFSEQNIDLFEISFKIIALRKQIFQSPLLPTSHLYLRYVNEVKLENINLAFIDSFNSNDFIYLVKNIPKDIIIIKDFKNSKNVFIDQQKQLKQVYSQSRDKYQDPIALLTPSEHSKMYTVILSLFLEKHPSSKSVYEKTQIFLGEYCNNFEKIIDFLKQ